MNRLIAGISTLVLIGLCGLSFARDTAHTSQPGVSSLPAKRAVKHGQLPPKQVQFTYPLEFKSLGRVELHVGLYDRKQDVNLYYELKQGEEVLAHWYESGPFECRASDLNVQVRSLASLHNKLGWMVSISPGGFCHSMQALPQLRSHDADIVHVIAFDPVKRKHRFMELFGYRFSTAKTKNGVELTYAEQYGPAAHNLYQPKRILVRPDASIVDQRLPSNEIAHLFSEMFPNDACIVHRYHLEVCEQSNTDNPEVCEPMLSLLKICESRTKMQDPVMQAQSQTYHQCLNQAGKDTDELRECAKTALAKLDQEVERLLVRLNQTASPTQHKLINNLQSGWQNYQMQKCTFPRHARSPSALKLKQIRCRMRETYLHKQALQALLRD